MYRDTNPMNAARVEQRRRKEMLMVALIVPYLVVRHLFAEHARPLSWVQTTQPR